MRNLGPSSTANAAPGLSRQRRRRLAARRWLTCWLLLTVWGALASCRRMGPGTDRNLAIVSRWIAEDPQEFFALREVTTERDQFDWSFVEPVDLAAWQMKGDAAAFERSARSLILRSTAAPYPALKREVDFDASEVDAIEVTTAGLPRGFVRFYWAGPGQNFNAERVIKLQDRDHDPGRPGVFTLELATEASWTGPIRRIQLGVGLVPSVTVGLRAIRGYQRVIDAERLNRATRKPWKIDLDSEVRNGLLALPGIPIERQLEVAGGSVLQFAFGTDASVREPIDFRVAITAPEGDPEVVFETTLAPDSGAGRWQEARVELPSRQQPIDVTFETTAPEAFDPAIGMAYWAAPVLLASARGPRPPSVVMIVLDTLRADHLSLYGYSRVTTPEIDAWARESGITFLNAVASAPWTLPSHTSIFTGLDALSHGLNHNFPVPASFNTLTEVLQQGGYRTEAVTGGVYLHPRYGFAQGFDRFRYWPSDLDQKGELASGIEVVLEGLERLRDQPFFLFFHTYEIHDPYTARQPFYSRLAGGEPASGGPPGKAVSSEAEPLSLEQGFVVRRTYESEVARSELAAVSDLYDSGIAFADHHLGRLFRKLEDLDLADDTLVVLTSDHGEALGDHGLAAHSYLYDFNLMVPLVFALPAGRGAGKAIENQVRSVDILPTVLELVGLPAPPGIDGRSLAPLIDAGDADFPREAWSYASSTNYGVSLRLSNRLKYIYNNSVWPAVQGKEELYRLTEDPAEESNLAAASRAETERLGERMRERFGQAFRGLKMGFTNAGPGAYRVRVASTGFLRPSSIKAFELPSDLVTAKGGRVEPTSIAVPAGSDFTVFFEAVDPQGKLRLRILADGAPPCRLALPIAELPPVRHIRVASDGCEILDEAVEPPPTGVTLELRLPFEEAVSRPEEADPELLEKLHALGYVDD